MRRGVIRALGAYILLVWVLAQGLVDLLPAVGFPDWAIQVFLAAAVAATPFVALVAWKYDLTMKGFLPDKVDAANRQAAASEAVGPTTKVSPRRGNTQAIMTASWRDEDGTVRNREFDQRFQVGRDLQADIRLVDDRVSRRHLEVYPVGDQWFVRDLSSLNGSYIDGDRIDVHKIERGLDVSLDRTGPVVHLNVRSEADTLLTVGSRQDS